MPFRDAGGNPCETVHAKPVWWVGEDSTNCLRDGKVVDVPTNHTDVGMVAALGGIIAAIIAK